MTIPLFVLSAPVGWCHSRAHSIVNTPERIATQNQKRMGSSFVSLNRAKYTLVVKRNIRKMYITGPHLADLGPKGI